MTSTCPRDSIRSARRLVVKIGSRILVDQDNQLDEEHIGRLVSQVARLRHEGREVVCVSSGAIAAGLGALGLSERPNDLPSLQAAAAIGQARIMGLYRQRFADHGVVAAQVLLTHADLRVRERHLNARNTFARLLQAGVVPVVNENDTVAVDEIRFGDNDMLSALVAMLLRADVLLLLTNVDGLMSRAPGGPGAESSGAESSGSESDSAVIPLVERVTAAIRAIAGGRGSAVSVGGMHTKVQAAASVTRAGEVCVIANGREPEVIIRIMRGEPLGTLFQAVPDRMAGRKRWIAFFDHPRGEVHVDEGAARALGQEGRSLLPIGVTAVEGSFGRGDPVRIIGPAGVEIGRGLVNFTAGEIREIAGKRSSEVASVLGGPAWPEVIHRDNLAVTG